MRAKPRDDWVHVRLSATSMSPTVLTGSAPPAPQQCGDLQETEFTRLRAHGALLQWGRRASMMVG